MTEVLLAMRQGLVTQLLPLLSHFGKGWTCRSDMRNEEALARSRVQFHTILIERR